MSKTGEKTRILFVQHEMKTWQTAKMWGYTFHLGLEEGFVANGVEFTTILSSWFPKAKELCVGKRFDQIWINDVTHMFEPKKWGEYQLYEADLEWLAGLAPVRLGFVVESLQYTDKELTEAPSLCYAYNVLKRTSAYLTHIMAVDEKDFDIIRQLSNAQLSWLILPVPQRCICTNISLPQFKNPTFHGSPYGERARWLKMPFIKDLLTHNLSSDNNTELPSIFDRLHRNLNPFAISSQRSLEMLHNSYLDLIRCVRRSSFDLYLADLYKESIVVNLPSYASIYTGRVFEGMASGRPVVTARLERSPRMTSLFEDEKEILLYSLKNPEDLVKHIKRVLDDPGFGIWIAENARNKLLHFHTVEKRVKQIITWIESGIEADFSYYSNAMNGTVCHQSELCTTETRIELPARLSQFETEFEKQLKGYNFIKHNLFKIAVELNKYMHVLLTMASKVKKYIFKRSWISIDEKI